MNGASSVHRFDRVAPSAIHTFTGSARTAARIGAPAEGRLEMSRWHLAHTRLHVRLCACERHSPGWSSQWCSEASDSVACSSAPPRMESQASKSSPACAKRTEGVLRATPLRRDRPRGFDSWRTRLDDPRRRTVFWQLEWIRAYRGARALLTATPVAGASSRARSGTRNRACTARDARDPSPSLRRCPDALRFPGSSPPPRRATRPLVRDV